MTTRAIKSPEQLARWVSYLDAQQLPLTVSAVKGVDRSLEQNRTFHMWIGQVSQETGDELDELKGYCKAKFGLPIMRRDNAEWVAKYEPMWGPLPHELRIAFFAIVPMTRLFKVPQMCEFMDAVQRHYLQQGFDLIDPDPQAAR